MSHLGPLLVVGTSNSALKVGYTSVLGDRFDPIINRSIGASTSVLPSFRAREMREIHDSWVFLDFCVNEARLNHLKGFSPDIQRGNLLSFLATCGEQRLKPLIHIMPSHWKVARNGPIRQAYADFAREHRLPWFDGFEFNERVYALAPEWQHYGFPVISHPEPPVSRLIGRGISRALGKFAVRPVQWVEVPDVPRVVAIHPEDHYPVERLFYRKTGIDSRHMLTIRPGEKIRFPIEPGDEIVGVALNPCESNAVMRIEAGTVRLKDVTTSLYHGRPYVLVAWPLYKPMPTSGTEVSIECLDKRETPEVDEHSDHHEPNVDLSDPHIEFGGLMVRRKGTPAIFPAFDEGIDIATLLTDEEVLEDIATEAAHTAATGPAKPMSRLGDADLKM